MSTDECVSTYRLLCVFRRFEEVVAEAVETGEVHGEMHLGIGQEAIAAAMSGVLRSSDAVVSTHRAHLHALALGVDPVALLAEVLEHRGLSRGKGGHMHLFSRQPQFMCTGIVGAAAPIATGYALAQQRRGSGYVDDRRDRRWRDEPGSRVRINEPRCTVEAPSCVCV